MDVYFCGIAALMTHAKLLVFQKQRQLYLLDTVGGVGMPKTAVLRKNMQYIKEHLGYFSSKNRKIVIKYIALNTEGVVQFGIIAGTCRPLRGLFIGTSYFNIHKHFSFHLHKIVR